jgi:hypothetical protein
MLRFSITLEGPAGELAARLRSVAAALEDPAPLAAPEHAPNSNNVRVAALEDPWVPLAAPAAPPDAPEPTPEPEQAPARQNGQTAAQRAALEAYRASLPKKTPPAPPAPRPAVVAEIHPPATADRKPARELWEEVKDDAERLRWFEAYGKEHGFPALMIRWSGGMTTQARAAWDRKPAAAPC